MSLNPTSAQDGLPEREPQADPTEAADADIQRDAGDATRDAQATEPHEGVTPGSDDDLEIDPDEVSNPDLVGDD
jgi:hypothetical protein